jgi:HK97 family phage major capsid protein
MYDQSAVRPLAKIITTESDRNIPVAAANGVANWTDEEEAATESDDTFGNVTLLAHKMTSLIKVSNELLEDSFFDLPTYIAEESARRFAVLEEDAYINGNGTGKAKGILNATGGADVGLTTASATAITADEIIDLYYSLKTPYRKNAVWMLNDATVKIIRKLKDTDGNYIWQPSLAAGTPDMIMGNKVVTSAAMPTLAATKKIIAFGDFYNYWIGDRRQMSLQKLVEAYAVTGQTGFIASRRVDGKLTIGESIKVMAMKA